MCNAADVAMHQGRGLVENFWCECIYMYTCVRESICLLFGLNNFILIF